MGLRRQVGGGQGSPSGSRSSSTSTTPEMGGDGLYHHKNKGSTPSTNNLYDDDEDDGTIAPLFPKPDGWGTRHTMALMGFWGFVASYAMRVNLSFAIVSMVNSTSNQPGGGGGSAGANVCTNLLPNNSHSLTTSTLEGGLEGDQIVGEFNWSGEQQGIILGSFFWGYVITQVPGGMLAERIGGKWPFGLGMLVTAIFSLVTPLAARSGMGALIFVRVIQGLGEGVTNPSMHALLARWAPPLERSKLGAFVYAGTQIGTVIAMPLSGYLISSNIWGGWPSVFYVFGVSGIIWFVFWCIFVFDSPANHPRIEPKELSYIQHSIGAQAARHRGSTPWRKMLTSMPVLAILVAQTGHGWGLYTLLTELPTYMKTVLHFDIKNNAVLSALPYLVQWIVSIVCSQFADYMRERNIASTTTVRKLFNTIAHWGPAIALIGASYSGCDRTLTVFLLTMAVGINGAAWASFQVNHIDIAPNHAAVMMGVTNGFANLCGIAAPYVAGVIINDGGSLDRWQLIFFISAAIYFVDNIFYLCFASGDEVSWNRGEKTDDYEEVSARDPLLPSSRSGGLFPAETLRSGTHTP